MYLLAKCKVHEICESLRYDNEKSRCDTSKGGSLRYIIIQKKEVNKTNVDSLDFCIWEI